jgi:hypothetical protein
MAQVADRPEGEENEDLAFRWRLETLRRVGYDERSSLLLALRPEVDLHTATDLVKKGCPVATAVRILL